MQTYDITLTISNDLPIWPGDPPIRFERVQKLEEGAVANVTHVNLGAHVGTHIDAPYHFLGGQAATVEKIPLKILVGRVFVVQVQDEVDLITAALLEKMDIPPRTRRIILKTRNTRYWMQGEKAFQTNYVALSADAAQFLVNKGIKLVGIDYLSIAPYTDPIAPHTILLKAGVVIVEGLDLSQVSPGRYSLYCLPLKLLGSDGAPARVILVGV